VVVIVEDGAGEFDAAQIFPTIFERVERASYKIRMPPLLSFFAKIITCDAPR
jgi:hypothetical protein